MKIIFSDKVSSFNLLDYNITHSQLLFRSFKNKQRNYNIDLIFKGVSTLNIDSFRIKGIDIIDKSTRLDKYSVKKFNIKNYQDYQVTIEALSFGIYHNELDILKSSIGRYYKSNLSENILWYK